MKDKFLALSLVALLCAFVVLITQPACRFCPYPYYYNRPIPLLANIITNILLSMKNYLKVLEGTKRI